LSKQLLVLLMRTVLRSPELEYVSLLVDIVNLALPNSAQRKIILDTILKEEDPATTLIDDEAGPYNYRRLMKNIEGQSEVRAVKTLHKKVQIQIRELEMWDKASKNPSTASKKAVVDTVKK
jgi:hypothetical protein